MSSIMRGEQITKLAASINDSGPKVGRYLNILHPERPQTGCVVRLGQWHHEIGAYQRLDTLVVPAGPLTDQRELNEHCDSSHERLHRMFSSTKQSSWPIRAFIETHRAQLGGAIRLTAPESGLAVVGWWEQYNVLHAVWLGLHNDLITSEAACAFINELDDAKFGAGMSAYHHLAPRLAPEPIGWVCRYFADQANHNPPRHAW